MDLDTKPKVKCSEIRDTLEQLDRDEVYFFSSNWAKTLLPFWQRAMLQIAENTSFYKDKASKYLDIATKAFELMDEWRSGNVKLVKARRSEIDSTISYMRNGAMLKEVSNLAFAPVSRNASSALRSSLNLACKSYSDAQLPAVVAQQIYAIAAVRTLFPVEDSNLIGYLPANTTIHGSNDPKDLDNYHLMFEIAAKQLHLSEQVNAMNNEAALIWQNFKEPSTWEIPEMIWKGKTDSLSTQLFYSNRAAFHRK